MKKTIILTWLTLAMAFNASAVENGVLLEFHRMSKPDTHTKMDRAPMHLPIDVIYDTDAHAIKIVGDESIDAEAYIYDLAGTLEDYSTSLNVTFSISTPGIHIINIQGDGWYAEGRIQI